MHSFRNVLIALDNDSLSPAVVYRARQLAEQGSVAIKLAAVVEDLPWYSRLVLPSADELQQLRVRDRGEALERLGASLSQTGANVSTIVLRGRHHAELTREAIRGGHDLLLKEAQANGNVPFGAVDMHLLRACPCPLWLARPNQVVGPLRRILVPVDPAPPPDDADLLHLKLDPSVKDPLLDVKLLNLAAALAQIDNAEVHVLHAWAAPGVELLRGEALVAPDQVERYLADARAEAQRALDHLLAQCPDSSGRRSVHLVEGDPAETIDHFVDHHHIDLVVMGTVARTGIAGFLIGNTAESILQRVGCSVLAVKPDGFASLAAHG